jgi:hypothetical protein
MTCKINADTTNGLKLESDTSGEIDIQSNGTTSINFSPSQITITDADSNQPRLLLKNTNADSSPPFLDFQKDSSSPADNDVIGKMRFIGDDDGGNTVAYATIVSTSPDVSDGSENGDLRFETTVDGTNAERMRIDSGGRVTIASIPSFLASGSSGTNATVSANNQFSFGSTDYNTGSHYSTANSRFTCPVSGLYWFYVSLHADTDADDCRPVLRVNGADYAITVDAAQAFARTPSPSVIQLNMSLAINLSANDYVELWARAGTGSTLYYQGHSWFGGYLIG